MRHNLIFEAWLVDWFTLKALPRLVTIANGLSFPVDLRKGTVG